MERIGTTKIVKVTDETLKSIVVFKHVCICIMYTYIYIFINNLQTDCRRINVA